MHTPDSLPLSQFLSLSQFEQLRTLLEDMAQRVGGTVLTEALLPTALRSRLNADRFILIASEPFSALLLGKRQLDGYQTHFTIQPEAISEWLTPWLETLKPKTDSRHRFERARLQLRPNQIHLQNEFIQKLIAVLVTGSSSASNPGDAATAASNEVSSPKPGNPTMEAALRQQIEQERLLNQVTIQIRQSLELPAILETAVQKVRQVLQADRLVIYRIDADSWASLTPIHDALEATESPGETAIEVGGKVIYEARSSEAIPSVLNFSEAHCFIRKLRYQEVNQRNLAIAIEDVELRYATTPCLLDFLHQAHIRSKLVAPILVGDELWGLLIAHQCLNRRRWKESEQRFLQHIAEHLAIAISQAQLYAEVQQQKQTLEQRVIERTQELRDMMMAAQSANRAKSEFLANVSHELRTPLTCIIGMSATLQRWSKDTLTDRQQHFLQTIHDSGEHLLSLINDILDLSQAEAGKVILNLREFSLSHLAQQTMKTFEGQAALSEVDLDLDLRIDIKRDRFVADPLRLRQILFNLLGNAIKFTPEGGRVTLRVFVEENLAIFQVKDTGIGISEAQLPLLFQKFQQLDSSYQRQYQGTGLGLALTKQLVELHGGWIDVESTEGVGSVFTVRIPMQRLVQGPVEQPLTGTPIAEHPKGRIFLIEHDEDNASLICDVLTAAGYQLVWILDGAAAIDQIETLRPITVIVNTRLSDSDGYSLIRRLRQNPVTKHLKILALTTPDQISEWKTAGADAHLVQPLRPDHLLQKIMGLMDTSLS